MRKIIEGVGYDTKNAIFLGQVSSEFSKEDIRWSVSGLYRITSGKYFLHGSGGPASPFSVWDNLSDSYIEGEVILPISQYDVITWAEENLPDEKLKSVLEDIHQEAKRHSIDIPTNLKTATRNLAQRVRQAKRAAVHAKEIAERTERTYVDW